jgi:CubicO group peptidase (beta-lactamase class C family)
MKKFLLFLSLLPLFLQAQKNYLPLIENYLQAQANFYEFSGTVLVSQKGKVIYKKAFGLANREWNIPNTVDTKFMIGSLTKQFTAAAILQLVEKGLLNLNDPLSKFFPGYPQGDMVTVHMLLSHTSGIKGYTDMPQFASVDKLSFSKDSVIAFFKNEPYDFTPGTKYKYSNSNYFLLGCIIEKVSGQPYQSYVKENLFRRAGLQSTGLNQLDSILPNRASPYVKSPQGWKNAAYVSMEFPFSAGAIFSTVDDLLQWNTALHGGKIISPAMLAKMTTPYLGKYGYGLHIDSLGNHKHIGHTGSIQGFVSSIEWYPQDETCVVILTNNRLVAFEVGQAIAGLLFDMPVQMPYQHKEAKIDPRQFTKYMGKLIT